MITWFFSGNNRFEVLTLTSKSYLFFFLLGGAGGKGTWGKLGCELELPWVDPNDPNYESEGEEVRQTVLS